MPFLLKHAKKQALRSKADLNVLLERISKADKNSGFNLLNRPNFQLMLSEYDPRVVSAVVCQVTFEHLCLPDYYTDYYTHIDNFSNREYWLQHGYVLKENVTIPLSTMKTSLKENRTELSFHIQTEQANLEHNIQATLLTIKLNEQMKLQKVFIAESLLENTLAGGGVVGFTGPLMDKPITKTTKKRKTKKRKKKAEK